MKRFYVYRHCRKDTGIVFYVGSGSEKIYDGPSAPYKRARDTHVTRRSAEWLATAAAAGGFIVEIVSEHETDAGARQAELEEMSQHTTLVNKRRQALIWSEEKRTRHGRKGALHANYGTKLSTETRAKKSQSLSGDKHHLKGKKLPDQWVAHIAAAKVGNKNPQFGKATPISRKVLNTATGAVYASIARAAKAEGISPGMLYQYLDANSSCHNHTALVKI